MSFIDKFLDTTANLPREIVRLLKLYKFVEQRSRNINESLKNIRIKHLKDIKEKNQEEENIFKITHDKYYKELLNLSDYKQSLIDELKYILEYNFLKKIEPIIEEGQKECQEQLLSSNMQLGSGFNKTTIDEKNVSIYSEKSTKNLKLLGIKTNRTSKNMFKKRNEINPEISGEYIPSNIDEDNQLHCKCKKPSYGKMIECEKCYEWFHYICVGIEEGKEPEHYFCEECAESMNDNKNKKREKNNKKKKYNQK